MLFIVVAYGIIYLNTNNVEDLIVIEENRISQFELTYKENLELIDTGNFNEDEVTEMKRYNNYLQSEIDDAKQRIKGFQEKSWEKILEPQIEVDNQWLRESKGLPKNETGTGQSPFTLESNLERNKLILERGIDPIFPIDLTLTIHENRKYETPKDEELWKGRTSKYSSTGLYFIYMLSGLFFTVTGVIFFLFLIGDIVTKEGYGRNGPIHFLYTQPVRRRKVLMGKFLTVLLVTGTALIAMFGFSLLLGTVFDRFGDGNYPILIYGADFTLTFMNLSTFLIKTTGLFFMILVFSNSLLFLFSILTRNTLAAIGVTVGIILIGIKMSTHSHLSKAAQYLPFSYFSAEKVVTNETAALMENFNITFTSGILVLGTYSIIILLISYALYLSKVIVTDSV